MDWNENLSTDVSATNFRTVTAMVLSTSASLTPRPPSAPNDTSEDTEATYSGHMAGELRIDAACEAMVYCDRPVWENEPKQSFHHM